MLTERVSAHAAIAYSLAARPPKRPFNERKCLPILYVYIDVV